MIKYIGQIYTHCQSQLSTFSLKTSVSSYSEPQKLSAIELTKMSVPSVTDKHQKVLVCIPKIRPRMMQPPQTMTTYSLVGHPKNKIISFQPFQNLIIIHKELLPHPQVY